MLARSTYQGSRLLVFIINYYIVIENRYQPPQWLIKCQNASTFVLLLLQFYLNERHRIWEAKTVKNTSYKWKGHKTSYLCEETIQGKLSQWYKLTFEVCCQSDSESLQWINNKSSETLLLQRAKVPIIGNCKLRFILKMRRTGLTLNWMKFKLRHFPFILRIV